MEPTFGRDRELAVIDDAIERSIRGERAVIMLTGEPGIGKTRLLDELARRAAERGARVAWGRSLEVGLTPAYWPWLEILRSLEVADDRAPVLGAAARETNARLAQFEAVAGFLARRAPVALVFDLQLLAAGHQVRTTVRSPRREADVRALLMQGGAEPGDRLSFAVADLEADAG